MKRDHVLLLQAKRDGKVSRKERSELKALSLKLGFAAVICRNERGKTGYEVV